MREAEGRHEKSCYCTVRTHWKEHHAHMAVSEDAATYVTYSGENRTGPTGLGLPRSFRITFEGILRCCRCTDYGVIHISDTIWVTSHHTLHR